MNTCLRLDFVGRLDGLQRTPQGGVRIPAHLTRVGVFPYVQPDGTVRRELRPPEEVFAEDSLATLRLAPVTVGHPGEVRADNYRSLAVGIVGENVRQSDRFVAGDVIVQDAATVAQVGSTLEEISCGYRVRLDMTPGTWEGQPYDVVQRTIRYNHVGLGPKNWGRAGNEVRLHLDSKDGGPGEDVSSTHYDSGMALTPEEIAAKAKLEAERDTLRTENERLAKENAGLRSDQRSAPETSGGKIDPDPKAIDALVTKRLDCIDAARVVLGPQFDGRADGKRLSEREVCLAVIAKADPAFRTDGKNDDYISARFDFIVEAAKRSDAAHAQVQHAATGSTTTTAPATGADPSRADGTSTELEKARNEFHATNAATLKNAAPDCAAFKR